eukprot:TCONS_00022950-protein
MFTILSFYFSFRFQIKRKSKKRNKTERMSDSSHLSCGRDFHAVPDIRLVLNNASSAGFDFICAPIAHPRYRRELVDKSGPVRPGAFTRTDLLLPGSDWSSLVVGKISPWIDLDSPCEVTRKNSSLAIQQELNFATHLSMPAILMKLRGMENANLAHVINNTIHGTHVQQIWLQVPFCNPKSLVDHSLIQSTKENGCEVAVERNVDDTWEWWNQVRNLCDNNRKLAPVLILNSKSITLDDKAKRWMGEPLKAIVLPSNIFLSNKMGYPVLSKDLQNVVSAFFKQNVQFIISGAPLHKNIVYYYQYLDHLYKKRQTDFVEQFSKGYEDYLQTPLQPLMDNLESQTYEVFEKDPVKYQEYQNAVHKALLDRVPDDKVDEMVTTIMVVGAGRGPLVRASFNAARDAGRKVKMYAVEKNPNAIVTLETLNKEEWNNTVTVVSCDMRHYKAPEKADILVSELLGSFSDNELSPECIDGAQRFLKEDGISIPCSYTSYATPLSAAKLHSEVAGTAEVGKIPDAPFEAPYVVRLQNVTYLDTPKPVFTFNHPNFKDDPIDNERYIKLEFQSKESTMIHGVAGFFDMVLYKDVVLSIVPETASPGMFSWFPAYFPIKKPIYCPKGGTITLHFWRKVSKTKVWYEWCYTSPTHTAIHNPNGRSYWIGIV